MIKKLDRVDATATNDGREGDIHPRYYSISAVTGERQSIFLSQIIYLHLLSFSQARVFLTISFVVIEAALI